MNAAKGTTSETPEGCAKLAVDPAVQSALVVSAYNEPGEPDIQTLVNGLRASGGKAVRGDLSTAERMLTAQAHALDAVFASCARRASANMGQHLNATDMYLRLALRAQAQCRATWETLATIKNPHAIAFVRQANITTGPQQVNNGNAASVAPGENAKPQSKLLETTTHEHAWLDARTPRTATAGDTAMAAVDAIHRPAHKRRKAPRGA